MGEAVTDRLDVTDRIVAFKRSLTKERHSLNRAYLEVKDHVRRAADRILSDSTAGRPVVPEVEYRDIKDGKVTDGTRAAIRKTGCAVVRGVFPASVATDWFAELGEYLDANHYEEREVAKRSLDKYFSGLKAGKPQIFNVYWSKPQVNARQDPRLAQTRAFLNRLWRYQGVFDPDRECTYADRVRRRQPGDDAGSFTAHGCRHGGALDRPRVPARIQARLRGQLAGLRSLRRNAPVGYARDSVAGRV